MIQAGFAFLKNLVSQQSEQPETSTIESFIDPVHAKLIGVIISDTVFLWEQCAKQI